VAGVGEVAALARERPARCRQRTPRGRKNQRAVAWLSSRTGGIYHDAAAEGLD